MQAKNKTRKRPSETEKFPRDVFLIKAFELFYLFDKTVFGKFISKITV